MHAALFIVTAADVHDAWATWMEPQNPLHAAIVPFDELPAATQDMDLIGMRQSCSRDARQTRAASTIAGNSGLKKR